MRTFLSIVFALVVSALLSYGTILELPEYRPEFDPIRELIDSNSGLVVEESSPVREEKTPDQQLFDDIIATEQLRLGVVGSGRSFHVVREEIGRFLEFVKLVESNGDRLAKAKTSSAMSYFQFTRGSVPTAVNRLENYMRRHWLGALPEWAATLRADPESIFDVSEDRQAILALVNIAEQRGSDAFLSKLIGGEVEAGKQAYFQFHHTNPDDATRGRVEKIFARVFN